MEQRMEAGPAPPVRRPPLAAAKVGVRLVAGGFANPVFLTGPPGGRDLYVVDQVGKVYRLPPTAAGESELFLDLSEEVVELDPGYDERGLLGLAFHPRFPADRRFFVFYSAPLRDGAPEGWNCTNYLAEYRASGDDPPRADPGSRRVLLAVDKPQMNHNGGHILFGPDGHLYVPLGDGGGENDRDEGHTPEVGNAQDPGSLMGKVLRIDVDKGDPYGIPDDNPFTGGGGRPEVFAYGLRNPYHISFDHETGDLFAGDVGQVQWEEVDIVVKGGNYGWNIKEGRHFFNWEANSSAFLKHGKGGEDLIDPILDYPNLANRIGGIGSAVIGGYVYRGAALPFLRGRYVFGDLSGTRGRPDGRIFVASPPVREGGTWVMDELAVEGREDEKLNEYVLSFAQDGDRELYVLSSDTEGPSGTSGRVYRIVPAGK